MVSILFLKKNVRLEKRKKVFLRKMLDKKKIINNY